MIQRQGQCRHQRQRQWPFCPMVVLQELHGRPSRRLERWNQWLTSLRRHGCLIGHILDGSRRQVNSANTRRKLEGCYSKHYVLSSLRKLPREPNSRLLSHCLSGEESVIGLSQQ